MIARIRSGLPGLKLAAVLVSSAIALSACSATTGSPAGVASTTASSNNPTASTSTSTDEQSESARLNQWFEQKFEERLQRSPLYLTILGRKEQYDQFDDASEAEEDREFAIATANLNELRNNFDYEKLDDEAKLSRDIWIYQYERDRKARKFRDHNYTFDQMSGIQSFYPNFMINFHRVDERSDMEAYVSRLGGIATSIRTLLGRAQKYAADGVRPPRFAYEGVIDQSQKIIEGAPFTDRDATEADDSAIWRDAKAKIAALEKSGKITKAEAVTLTGETKDKLLNEFAPAYNELISWVKEDLANTNDVASGVGALTRGKA